MLIQSILFFILGSATTALVLVLIGPIIWRRALYLAHKIIATEVPLSLKEVEADRDFLRARHAVEQVRIEEKLNTLKVSYNEQKIQFDKAKEVIATAQNELQIEKNIVDTLNQTLNLNIDEIRQQLLQMKINDPDEKARKEEIKTMRSEIETLKHKLEEKINHQNETANNESLDILRDNLKEMVAIISANVAIDEGDNSPIFALIADAGENNSLAAQIQKQITFKQNIKPTTTSSKVTRTIAPKKRQKGRQKKS